MTKLSEAQTAYKQAQPAYQETVKWHDDVWNATGIRSREARKAIYEAEAK